MLHILKISSHTSHQFHFFPSTGNYPAAYISHVIGISVEQGPIICNHGWLNFPISSDTIWSHTVLTANHTHMHMYSMCFHLPLTSTHTHEHAPNSHQRKIASNMCAYIEMNITYLYYFILPHHIIFMTNIANICSFRAIHCHQHMMKNYKTQLAKLLHTQRAQQPNRCEHHTRESTWRWMKRKFRIASKYSITR